MPPEAAVPGEDVPDVGLVVALPTPAETCVKAALPCPQPPPPPADINIPDPPIESVYTKEPPPPPEPLAPYTPACPTTKFKTVPPINAKSPCIRAPWPGSPG